MTTNSNISYKKVTEDKELNAILDLQKSNHYSNLTIDEQQANGFLTVQHSFKLLKEMNAACSHIIAMSNGEIAGYALCMLPSFKDRITVLQPMFDLLDTLLPEKDENIDDYVIMGQICISEKFRKKGIFRGLYQFMEEALKGSYKGLITEVDLKNKVSLGAHYAVGFTSLKQHRSNNQDWDLIWMHF